MRYIQSMHIITRKRIAEASAEHKDCVSALNQWYRLMKKAELTDFGQLRNLFPSVDKVDDLYVFNIGGNKMRLIAAIHFDKKRVFIRAILTLTEYDKSKWRE